MANPWFRVDADAGDDPIFGDLADRLGLDYAEHAFGHYVKLLGRVAVHAQNGDLGRVSPRSLEDWAGWRGERGRFATAFRELFVDAAGQLRGWLARNAKLLERSELERLRSAIRRARVAGRFEEAATLCAIRDDIRRRAHLAQLDEEREDTTEIMGTRSFVSSIADGVRAGGPNFCASDDRRSTGGNGTVRISLTTLPLGSSADADEPGEQGANRDDRREAPPARPPAPREDSGPERTPAIGDPPATKRPAKAPAVDPPGFADAWNARPRRLGGDPRATAAASWRQRIREGIAPETMARQWLAYRRYCEARYSIAEQQASRFVMRGETFLSPSGDGLTLDWDRELRLWNAELARAEAKPATGGRAALDAPLPVVGVSPAALRVLVGRHRLGATKDQAAWRARAEEAREDLGTGIAADAWFAFLRELRPWDGLDALRSPTDVEFELVRRAQGAASTLATNAA